MLFLRRLVVIFFILNRPAVRERIPRNLGAHAAVEIASTFNGRDGNLDTALARLKQVIV